MSIDIWASNISYFFMAIAILTAIFIYFTTININRLKYYNES
jgi:hypothetical protein